VAGVPEATASAAENLLRPVWRDGKLLRDASFAEVRVAAALPVTPAVRAA